ncbi:hypothetical protein CXF92_20450 [Pseudomonas sp. Choline-3u-10]|nr:hypothetical protein RT21_13895 [Pseudomonas sp. 10B238]MAL35389.1 hypothetical protein [Pseudomonas sp.]PKG90593.1 hypothetical protein CXF92_20450 [Pseudomonas sp. Choline-3u-10]HBM08312.1 hypothetical protein [Pseudomonas sp.]
MTPFRRSGPVVAGSARCMHRIASEDWASPLLLQVLHSPASRRSQLAGDHNHIALSTQHARNITEQQQ